MDKQIIKAVIVEKQQQLGKTKFRTSQGGVCEKFARSLNITSTISTACHKANNVMKCNL